MEEIYTPTILREETQSAVSGHFSSAHKSKEGVLHGHTWNVLVWVQFRSGNDAEDLRAKLDEILEDWDHKFLHDEFSQGEVIALAISRSMGIAINEPDAIMEVVLSRPSERIYARWIKL